MPYRFARVRDIPTMRALNRMFSRAFEDTTTYEGAPPDDAYLQRQLAREDLIVLAAMKDDSVVGGLVAHVLPKLEQARSEVYIYDMAVDEAHRRQHIATDLIETLKPLARAQGAWVIFVQADPPDAPAVALYESMGTREEVFHYDIPVTSS